MSKFADTLMQHEHILELDDEEQETSEQVIQRASIAELLDNIGKNGFKYIYSLYENDLKHLPISIQREFLANVLETFEIKYDLSFFEKPELNLSDDVKSTYELLEFLEIDSSSFFVEFFQSANISDIVKFDINAMNNQEICETINKFISKVHNKFIKEFLTGYEMKKFRIWFMRQFEQQKFDLIFYFTKGK